MPSFLFLLLSCYVYYQSNAMKIFFESVSFFFLSGYTIALCPMVLKMLAARGLDPATQYVSTTGVHEFVPPGEGDLRGPCPGLNAMANQ